MIISEIFLNSQRFVYVMAYYMNNCELFWMNNVPDKRNLQETSTFAWFKRIVVERKKCMSDYFKKMLQLIEETKDNIPELYRKLRDHIMNGIEG